MKHLSKVGSNPSEFRNYSYEHLFLNYLLDFFRFTLFFLPDRFFDEKKPNVLNKNQNILVESEIDGLEEEIPLTGSVPAPPRKKTSFMKPPIPGKFNHNNLKRAESPNHLGSMLAESRKRDSRSVDPLDNRRSVPTTHPSNFN